MPKLPPEPRKRLTQDSRKQLPENPSEENLRKQAKHLAKEESLQLAAAQRQLLLFRIRVPKLGRADEGGHRGPRLLVRSAA